jgi:glycerophosphoryl diester phosphodiesterase
MGAGLSKPLVIAHRGASAHRPQNTLPAFELAVAQRADMIETDLHRTSDGAIVITHDEDLTGLGGVGEIAGATLAEIRALDAGGGERVPTLDEILDRFGPQIPFNLELKRATDTDYEGLEAQALAAVNARGLLARTLWSSFYDSVLGRLRALAPDARLALLISSRYPIRILERARELGAEAINPEAGIVSAALVDDAHAAGLAVYVFTVDDLTEMQRLLALGVDGLFTNHPERLRALVDSEPA